MRLINISKIIGALLIVGDSCLNLCQASQLEHSQLNANCKKICKEYSEQDLNRGICNPTLNLQPRPGVYRACLNGLLIAFEHACMPTCMGESYPSNNAKHHTPGDSYNVCKSEWNRPRPNNQLPWCRRGYDVTFENVKKEIKKITDDLSKNADTFSGEEELSVTPTQMTTEKLTEDVNEENGDLTGGDESLVKSPQVTTAQKNSDEKESIENNGNDEPHISTVEQKQHDIPEVEDDEVDEFINESEKDSLLYEEEVNDFLHEKKANVLDDEIDADKVDSKPLFTQNILSNDFPKSEQVNLNYASNLRAVSSLARKSLNSSIDSETILSKEL